MKFIDCYDGLKRKLNILRADEISKEMKIAPAMTFKAISDCADKMEVDHIELDDNKMVKMYIIGAKEPIRMYPDVQSVWFTAYYKRFIPLITNNLSEAGLLKKIIILLSIRFYYNIAVKWFEHIFTTYQGTLKEEYYSQPVKEVRRVLKGKINKSILDALTLILEYDSGYRYRFQDMMMELNKENLIKNTYKEIARLLDIITYREGLGKINPESKWQKMKKVLRIVLLSPKIKKKITSILNEINIDEVKLSREDLYWTNQNPTHLFRGLPIEERQAENIKKYGSIK